MNKKEFINNFKNKTNYEEDICIIINDIIEKHFIIGKNNKEKIITDLKQKLNIEDDEANNIYNNYMEIIGKELKEKIKHPFKDLDKK